MRVRPFGAAVAVLLAAGLLAGCRTNVGVAATVNGERISENQVTSYLTPTGAKASLVAQAAQAGQTLPPPKALVLDFLIEEKLLERALGKAGGMPTAGQLAGYHDQLSTQLSGSALEKNYSNQLVAIGVTSSFTSRLVRTQELQRALASRVKSQAEFDVALRAPGVHVTINPRYGVWDAAKLSVDSRANAGLPSYLTIRPTASPTTQP